MGDGHDSDEEDDDAAKSGDKLGVEPAPPTLPFAFRFATVSIESIVFIMIIIKSTTS